MKKYPELGAENIEAFKIEISQIEKEMPSDFSHPYIYALSRMDKASFEEVINPSTQMTFRSGLPPLENSVLAKNLPSFQSAKIYFDVNPNVKMPEPPNPFYSPSRPEPVVDPLNIQLSQSNTNSPEIIATQYNNIGGNLVSRGNDRSILKTIQEARQQERDDLDAAARTVQPIAAPINPPLTTPQSEIVPTPIDLSHIEEGPMKETLLQIIKELDDLGEDHALDRSGIDVVYSLIVQDKQIKSIMSKYTVEQMQNFINTKIPESSLFHPKAQDSLSETHRIIASHLGSVAIIKAFQDSEADKLTKPTENATQNYKAQIAQITHEPKPPIEIIKTRLKEEIQVNIPETTLKRIIESDSLLTTILQGPRPDSDKEVAIQSLQNIKCFNSKLGTDITDSDTQETKAYKIIAQCLSSVPLIKAFRDQQERPTNNHPGLNS